MKKNLLTITAAAALAAGMAFAQTSAPAPAPGPQQGQGRAWRHRGMFRQRMARALNLTDAQKAQAKAIFQEAKQTAQPLRDQVKQTRQALSDAVKANDTAKIQSLSAQLGSLRGQLLTIRSEAMAKFYGTLNADQRTKVDQLKQRMHTRMERRFRKNG
jgi:Spy/CpxP family protein refolding chaperone